ncbi:MAG TPA: hypothetical protein VFN61_10970 [Acidimicrobiales bacterium]|nr:hypothetical protein [Acidimicrobiales bacterium]
MGSGANAARYSPDLALSMSSAVAASTTAASLRRLSGIALAVALILSAAPLASLGAWAATPDWHVVKSPVVQLANGSSYAFLGGISCPTERFCVAVGVDDEATATGGERPLLETYDGRHWATLPSLSSGGGHRAASGSLSAVSCASALFCMAVGSGAGTKGSPLVYVYTAMRWSVVAPPAGNSYLAAVACPEVQHCVVTTSEGNPPGPVGYIYDHGRWRPATAPTTLPGLDLLRSISCLDVRSCIAVGDESAGGPGMAPLAGRFDGTSWSAQKVDLSSDGYESTVLAAVSCASLDECLAVGYTLSGRPGRLPNGPVAELSRHGTWTSAIGAAGAQIRATALNGVSCQGLECLVIGTRGHAAFIDSYSANGWSSPMPGPFLRPGRNSPSGLWSVSCASPSFCVAVGSSGDQPTVVEGRA